LVIHIKKLVHDLIKSSYNNFITSTITKRVYRGL